MTALQLSPDDFRRIAKQVTDLAAEYLESMDSRPISPQATGADTERLFRSVLPEEGAGEEVWKELQPVIQHSRAQNGRFFGYVLGSGEPLGAMADLLASILNQNVTAWRSGPAAVTLELTVVHSLAVVIDSHRITSSHTERGRTELLLGYG